MTNKLTHHHLSAEAVNDEHGLAILLTQQDGIEEPHSVLVHPWQLHAVCEQFGIIASDQQAAKTIATLQRRMRGLFERIDKLDDWLTHQSDHQNADLSHELASIGALYDLAREWCADFEGAQQAIAEPSAKPSAEPLEALATPQKSEKVATGQLAFNV